MTTYVWLCIWMDLLVGEGPQAIDEGHHDYNADDDHDDLPTVYLYLMLLLSGGWWGWWGRFDDDHDLKWWWIWWRFDDDGDEVV